LKIKALFLVLTILALIGMPYSFYSIYRVIGVVVFAYLFSRNELKVGWKIFWTISILIIQPFFKIQISKSFWIFLDVIWIVTMLLSIYDESKDSEANV